VGCVLLAETAILTQGQFFLHLFLIAFRVMRDTTAQRTLQFYHGIFDLSHTSQLLTYLKSFFTLRENSTFVNSSLLKLRVARRQRL
jgi:hypothetical protein